MTAKIFFFTASFSLMSLIGLSQNSLQFLSATTGAACQSIKYYNGYVFTGTGSTLRAYYVDNGDSLPYNYVFEYRYVSEIIRMTIKGQYLYVAANYDGMTKWDISNPAQPVKIFEILPDSADMSTQGIGFKGDTIFLAQYKKVSVYKDLGTSYYKIDDFGYAPCGGSVTGVAVKNNLCAYTVSQIGSSNGVYLYNASTFSFISFYQQGNFFNENVIWGKNNNLLHVMGGTNTVNGYFYTLDVTNPLSPQKIFGDTVLGAPFGLAMALPYNAENINDTIYVANWGGLKPNSGFNSCYIRVYDATNPSNVHLLTYIPAGLWHFDMTVHYPKMYVASEWYGVKTVDISDIFNPVDKGNTLTGGWNLSSDAWGNYMTVANEGYGFKLYNISNVNNPVLINVNNDPGFCFQAKFSDDGNYIYTCNSTYQGFRIYTRDSLHQISHIQQTVCNGKFIVYQNRIFSKLDNKLKIIDVSNSYSPVIDTTVFININDMAVSNGFLYISNNDSIIGYNVGGNNFQQVVSVAMGAYQNAQIMAAYNNELFVYVINKGLVKYHLVFNNPNYSLVEDTVVSLVNGAPTYMAADTFGLYVSYRLKGLFAFDRQTFLQKGYYRTGLDYRKFADQYGVRDLFCKNNLIFLVEYFAQTSILTGDSTFLTHATTFTPVNNNFIIFPNPASDIITIKTDNINNDDIKINIYNTLGELMLSSAFKQSNTYINIGNLSNGIYLLEIISCGYYERQKFIIQK